MIPACDRLSDNRIYYS